MVSKKNLNYKASSGSEASLPFALAHANDPEQDTRLDDLAMEAKAKLGRVGEAVGRMYGESLPSSRTSQSRHPLTRSVAQSPIPSHPSQIRRDSISGPLPHSALIAAGLLTPTKNFPINYDADSPASDRVNNVFTRICGRKSSDSARQRPKSEAMVSRTLLLDDLFGAPLEAAVLASGVKVGYFVGSGEPCVVPAIIAICGQHLVKNGQKTNGIFRISGSMKRVHRLQSEFKRDKEFGKNIDWYGYTMHDTATVFRRYLTKLPGSIIPIEFYERFRKVLRAESEAERNEKFSVLIYKLPVFQRHTLLYILHILNIFAKSENNTATLMDASNLAAVFQPSLLVHPDHIMKPEEYARSKDVVEYLISNVTSFYPPECLPKSSISVRALLSPGDRLSSLAAAQREIMMDGKYGVISDEPIIFHAQVGGDGGNSSSSNSGEAGVVSTFSARRVPARLYDPASASTIARRASLVLSGGRSPDNQPIDLLAAINYNYRSNRISKDWTVTGAPPRQSDVSQYVAPGGPPPRSPSSAGLVATQPSSSHSSIALAYNPAATDTVSQSLPSRLGSYATNSSSEAIYSRHKIPSRSVKNGTTSGGDHRTKPVSSPKPNQQATSAIPFSVEGRDGIQPDAGVGLSSPATGNTQQQQQQQQRGSPAVSLTSSGLGENVDCGRKSSGDGSSNSNSSVRPRIDTSSMYSSGIVPRISNLPISPDTSQWLDFLPSHPLHHTFASEIIYSPQSRFGDISSLPPPPPERWFQPAIFNHARYSSKETSLPERTSRDRILSDTQTGPQISGGVSKPQTPTSDHSSNTPPSRSPHQQQHQQQRASSNLGLATASHATRSLVSINVKARETDKSNLATPDMTTAPITTSRRGVFSFGWRQSLASGITKARGGEKGVMGASGPNVQPSVAQTPTDSTPSSPTAKTHDCLPQLLSLRYSLIDTSAVGSSPEDVAGVSADASRASPIESEQRVQSTASSPSPQIGKAFVNTDGTMPPMRPSVSGSGRRESDCTDKGERPQSFRLLNFSRSDVDAHSTDSSTQYIWRHLTNTQQLSSTAVASPHHILQERLDPRQAQPMNESKSQVRQEKGFKRQSMNALNRLRRRWSKGHRSSKVIPEHTLIDESEGEVSAVGTPTMHHAS